MAPPTADADTVLQPGTQLVYRGGVSEVRRDGPAAAQPSKSFDLTLPGIASDATGSRVPYWLVEERGQGVVTGGNASAGCALDANFRPIGPQGPALLLDYGTGRSTPIPLLAPFFERLKDQPLDANNNGKKRAGGSKSKGRSRSPSGQPGRFPSRTTRAPSVPLWVDREAPLLVSYSERVFMDKGTEYQLEMRW